MSTSLGDYLQTGLKAFLRALDIKHPSVNADKAYKLGMEAKNGLGREKDLREAFLRFKEASENGHQEATAELAECYRIGSGCRRDIKKAVDLGSPKAALTFALQLWCHEDMERSVEYFWMASDGGESAATERLASIYKEGIIVERDLDESKRLHLKVLTQFNKSSDGLAWRIDQKSNTLFIRGNQAMDDYKDKRPPWEPYKSAIHSIVLLEGVRSIGSDAFTEYDELQSVDIPTSVELMDSNPFIRCPKLSTFHISPQNSNFTTMPNALLSKNGSTLLLFNEFTKIPSGITTFAGKLFYSRRELVSIAIPETLIQIGVSAFENCSNLLFVNILSQGCVILEKAFCNCSQLRTINLDSVAYIGENAFKNTPIATASPQLSNPEAFIRIGESYLNGEFVPRNVRFAMKLFVQAFDISNCFVGIPQILLNLSEDTIWNCEERMMWSLNKEMKALFIKAGEERVQIAKDLVCDDYSCMGTHSLVPWAKESSNQFHYAVIFHGLPSIGSAWFRNCSQLAFVVVPYGITSIGSDAFASCCQLKNINIPNTVNSICKSAFEWCSQLESINIPDSVTSIGEKAFYGCIALNALNISNSITCISEFVFCNCNSLKSVEIPSKVTTILKNAFSNCRALVSVNIPSSVTTIEAEAFANCYNLEQVNMPENIPNVNDCAFIGCNLLSPIFFTNNV